MQREAGQENVGEIIDTSFPIYSMPKYLDGIYLLTFVLRGGADVTLPLSQHLCILEHVIVTDTMRGFCRTLRIYTWPALRWRLCA